MKWTRLYSNPRHNQKISLRHEFAIGPQVYSELFGRAVRTYYCFHCKWTFLVADRRVAVLAEDGRPIAGEESIRRFHTFAEGPCPVLEAFVSAALTSVDSIDTRLSRQPDECRNLAAGHVPAYSGESRPVLRLLTRVRED